MGTLNPNDHCEFLWEAFIQAHPDADSGANAGGTPGIALTDPADAPLPSAVFTGLGPNDGGKEQEKDED